MRTSNLMHKLLYQLSFHQSPKPGVREAVNRWLAARRPQSSEELFARDWKDFNVSEPIVHFLFRYLDDYLGLDSTRLLPTDRLRQDLHIDDVGWSDWQADLVEGFQRGFGVKLYGKTPPRQPETLLDLVLYLQAVVNEREQSAGQL